MQPVRVKIQVSQFASPMDALMYAIHYVEGQETLASCYLINSKSWITCSLAFVEPIIDEETSSNKIKNTKKLLIENKGKETE